MAEIKRLVPTKKLKTTLLKTFRPGEQHLVFVKYDPVFDALMILLVPPETETVVHYIDEHVGLLYTPDNLEIVGIQVEAFEHSFLASHDTVRKVWRLSDSCNELEDVGDMILAVEKAKPKVAREVAKATENVLGQAGKEFAKAIEYAYA